MKIQLVLGAALLALWFASSAAEPLTTAEVKQQIIRESIAAYPGRCPCPYNTASNGSRCGGRSAYSRGGGYAPKCYPDDVTEGMVDAWRKQHQSG